jgi:hypothetical protein
MQNAQASKSKDKRSMNGKSNARKGPGGNAGTESKGNEDEGFMTRAKGTLPDLSVKGVTGKVTKGLRQIPKFMRSSENIVPIALGSFAIGATAGAVGALMYPRVRDSNLVHGLSVSLRGLAESASSGWREMSARVSDAVANIGAEAVGGVVKGAANGAHNGVVNVAEEVSVDVEELLPQDDSVRPFANGRSNSRVTSVD